MTKPQVGRLEARFGDPSAAGRKGVAVREALVLDHLTETRQYVNALAPAAAQYVGEVVTGQAEGERIRLDAARDVLDRTIGKAPTELRIGPSEQATDIIKELSDRDARSLEASSSPVEAP